MSAFQVSTKHIDALVSARALLAKAHYEVAGRLSDARLGQIFIRENMFSIAARYNDEIDETEIVSYDYTKPAKAYDVVTLIKAVHCYEYQACEHTGWNGSDAKKYCAELVDGLTRQLPGYTDAPWGID